MAEPEQWTTVEVATHLGVAPESVRNTLSRLGVKAVARQPGRSGLNLYDAAEVRAAAAARPGRGARTDLSTTTPEGN